MNVESLNLKRLLLQQLRSYQASGLNSLPIGAGELRFDLGEPSTGGETGAGTGGQSAGAAHSISAAPSQKGLSQAQPQADPRSNALAQPDLPSVAQTPQGQSPEGSDSPKPAEGRPDAKVPGSELALPYPQSLPLAQRQQQLTVLQNMVADCTRCDELASSRSQTVFGVGTPTARLVFVGEGPGVDEDRQGEPFVGAAGQLLNKILGACQLSREQVYILNVVKCRPPRNRNPSDAERSCCWGYAREQLEILQPEFICCLGSVAARSLLSTNQPLGRLRQQFHSYRGSRVIVTYHPAYLLRTPTAKRHVWDDMKLLMKAMGVDL